MSQLAGRFRSVWQVMGSNHRRLSRRFYRPLALPAQVHAADQQRCAAGEVSRRRRRTLRDSGELERRKRRLGGLPIASADEGTAALSGRLMRYRPQGGRPLRMFAMPPWTTASWVQDDEPGACRPPSYGLAPRRSGGSAAGHRPDRHRRQHFLQIDFGPASPGRVPRRAGGRRADRRGRHEWRWPGTTGGALASIVPEGPQFLDDLARDRDRRPAILLARRPYLPRRKQPRRK